MRTTEKRRRIPVRPPPPNENAIVRSMTLKDPAVQDLLKRAGVNNYLDDLKIQQGIYEFIKTKGIDKIHEEYSLLTRSSSLPSNNSTSGATNN